MLSFDKNYYHIIIIIIIIIIVIECLYVKKIWANIILSVEQEAIVGNVNLASNHGAIYKDLYGINKVLSLLNERGDPHFYFQI